MERLLVFVLFTSVAVIAWAAPLKQGNLLVVRTAKISEVPTNGDSDAEFCTSDGGVYEISSEGKVLQEIKVPSDCLFFYNPYLGHLTLSTDGFSAILPCCIDPSVTPQTTGFFEIFNNGTMSPLQTLQLQDNATQVANIAKHGANLWFGAQLPAVKGSLPRLYYANLTASTTVKLLEEDLLFVNIINNKLLVSNNMNLDDGIMQVGTDLPRTEDPELSSVLNQGIVVNGFVSTDNYAYYAQATPEKALVRCDPNTWAPLYSFNFTTEVIHFAVLYESAESITIIASLFDSEPTPWIYSLEVLQDNGAAITRINTVPYEDNFYIKSGSQTPITHCMNNETDFDETDVDCGGSLCDTCQVGKECSSNTDCASNYCDSTSSTCADQSEPLAGQNPIKNPTSQTSSAGTTTYIFRMPQLKFSAVVILTAILLAFV